MRTTTSSARQHLSSEHLSQHACQRMQQRSISINSVTKALAFGRVVRIRGASVYVIGRKEVARFSRDGIDLSSQEGVQVVCSKDGTVITVYRNRELRGLKPRRRRGCRSVGYR